MQENEKGVEFYKHEVRMASKTPQGNIRNPSGGLYVFFFRILNVSLRFCDYAIMVKQIGTEKGLQADPVIGPRDTSSTREVNKARLFLTTSVPSAHCFSFSNSPTDGPSISLSSSLRYVGWKARKG